MKLWCCGCEAEVKPHLTDGSEIYPHRNDLRSLPFWICRTCKNFVGCHHKTENRTNPLGCIPTQEIKNARKHIHRVLDPLWRTGAMSRSIVYQRIADEFGLDEYHTAEIRSVEQAREVYRYVKKLERDAEQNITEAID